MMRSLVGPVVVLSVCVISRGQSLLHDLTPGAAGTVRVLGSNSRGVLMLGADTAALGNELHLVDAWGSLTVVDVAQGASSSLPVLLGEKNGIVILSCNTTQGPRRPLRFESASSSWSVISQSAFTGGIEGGAVVDFGVVYSGEDTIHGIEPWITAGAPMGMGLLLDMAAGPLGSYPQGFVGNGHVAFFNCGQFCDKDPWFTTGQVVGHLDINPGAFSGSDPRDYMYHAAQHRWYFSATLPTTGRELYVTDTTMAGTQILEATPGPGTGGGLPSVACAAYTLTIASDGIQVEPWVTDGTVVGMHLLLDVNPGPSSSYTLYGYDSLVSVAGGALMFLNDGSHGTEPWFTDGTAANTHLVADINPGLNSSVVFQQVSPPRPRRALAIGSDNTMAFVADDGIHGPEIWVTDGTAAGTFMLPETLPGAASAAPQDLVRAGPNVFFTGDDGVHGRELWWFPTALTRAAVVETLSPPCAGGQAYPRITTQSVPQVGNGAFGIGVTQAQPNSLGVLLVAFQRIDQVANGCTVFPETPGVTWTVTTSAVGAANVPIPIPLQPVLVGAQLYAQWGVVKPGGPVAGIVQLSDALFVQVGK